MSRFKKSKYKSNEWNWWEHEDDYATGSNTWKYTNWYKPKYDMSISLETRVIQLIKTITGKSLKLVQADGWGNDDKHFYYNPKELENASDDEVLGRILHQIALQMYMSTKTMRRIQNLDSERVYRHLLESLEGNRVDRLLTVRYPGVQFYQQEVWGSTKFTENPILTYGEPITLEMLVSSGKVATSVYQLDPNYKIKVDQLIREGNQKRNALINNAQEFLFNIKAYQNGETDFDFTDDKVLENFKQAIPHIEDYLNSQDIHVAKQHYDLIKPFYPVPDEEQQKQMDKNSGQGLSEAAMERALKQIKDAKGQSGYGDQDQDSLIQGRLGGLGDHERDRHPNLNRYKQLKSQHQPVINILTQLFNSILKDNAVKRFQAPFKRGKVDKRRMYKYLAQDNLRIFKKPKAISQKKYMMTICVDMSGSMSGDNATNACIAAVILSEVFESIGLPYQVLGFNDRVMAFKKFKNGLVRSLIPELEHSDGGTNDYKALEFIEKELNDYDPQHVIKSGVFMVTDGESGSPHQTAELVERIEKQYKVPVFGIGIGRGMSMQSLSNVYKRALVVDNVRMLPSALISLVRSQFVRRQ